jgi:hypothetical protein
MKTSILACLVALVAVAGFAQAPGENPSTPAVLASPAAAAVPAAKQPLPTKATCTARCTGSTSVSCTTTGTGTCSAVDRDCGTNERGHVTCNGVTTNCPTSCACGTVCNCAAPCFTTPCDSGGGYIIDCSSWGICNSSCYCGGECLQGGDPSQSSALSGGNCATPPQADPLLAKIFG